jgi:tRNA threonylcarbamoyladenosine modification (KEOPS) complex  Pcc1 subunit
MSQTPFSIKSIIELNFKDSKIRDNAYNSYLPEFNKLKTKRSHISIEKKENSLIFQIESQDITAFRATVSDIIALGKIIENTIELTK